MRATGNNPVMASANGVNVGWMTIFGVALANGMVGVSGGLVAQYQGFADIGMGIGTVVIGLAAVIIGESVFRFNSIGAKVCSVVIGSVIFRMIIAIALYVGMNPIDLKLLTAVFVFLTLVTSKYMAGRTIVDFAKIMAAIKKIPRILRRSGRRACRACARSPSTPALPDSSGADDEEKEQVAGHSVAGRIRGAPVFHVECLDALAGQAPAGRRLRQRFRRRVGEIGEQSEMQARVAIGEEPDLQRFDQGLDVFGAGQERRDHHQRARRRRQPAGIVHPRQLAGRHQQRRQPVHHPHRQLAGGDEQDDAERREQRVARTVAMRHGEEDRGEGKGDDRDCAQVEQQGDPPHDPGDRLEGGHAHRRGPFELRPPAVDQVVADVGGAIVVAVAARLAGGASVRELDRLPRHLAFGQVAPFRDLLDHVPVAIAGREVHPAVESARILPQFLLDDAHRFDELAPVHRTEKAKTADGVAHRDLGGGLLLGLGLHQLLDRKARFGQPLLDPGERQGQGSALSLQPACEFGDERTHHGRVRAGHVRDHQDQAVRIVLGDVGHLVGPRVGPVAVDRAGGDPGADAAQVLDQRQPQHDGNGPQFAQLERRHRLVGRHETGEALRVDPAVAVGDRLEREIVDTRKAGGRSLRQAGKLAAVALGQVPLGRADLLVDQVEVVEQPFRGGRDPPVGRDRRAQQVADVEQDALRSRPGGSATGPARGPVPAGAPPRGCCRAAPSDRR